MSQEFEEGRAAAEQFKHFARECPYTFDRFTGTTAEFQVQWKQKLDDWFAGWQAGLKENGLEVAHGFVVRKKALNGGATPGQGG